MRCTVNIVDYIREQLNTKKFPFQWKIVINSKKKVIELFVTFRIEVGEDVHLEDAMGVKNSSNYIQFEDALVFFDPLESIVSTERYLYGVPISINDGAERGLIDVVIKQLTLSVNGGRNQLREFLDDDKRQSFSLQWNEKNFIESIELLKDTNRYQTDRLTVDFDYKKSLTNELKGHVYDGVERV